MKPSKRQPYLALQVSVVLVVFILLLFNLGGWFLWQVSLRRLDERLDNHLLEVGSALRVYIESRPLGSVEEPNEEALLDCELYIEQYAEQSTLRRIFLFDREESVLYDSLEEVEPGQKEPLLEADNEQLRQIWLGQSATTPFYPTQRSYTKRGYVPIRGTDGQPLFGLALEAGSSYFVDLGLFRRVLSTMSLLSIAGGLLVVLVLVPVVRRARRLEEMMERTERAIEAGQLTAALAHELRNPLGIIHTNAEVLLNQVPENAKEAVGDIIEEVERLSSLVLRFLNLSSQRPGDWASCSLGTLAQKAAARHTGKLETKGIQIRIERVQENDEIQAQADRLESVLDNLLDNAEHALEGKPDGQIEIEVRCRRKQIEMEVRDNGPGFSPEALEMAVQPFYSGRPRGTGIGLAICRRIVEDHGGKLTLRNRAEGGAGVKMVFPQKQ